MSDWKGVKRNRGGAKRLDQSTMHCKSFSNGLVCWARRGGEGVIATLL